MDPGPAISRRVRPRFSLLTLLIFLTLICLLLAWWQFVHLRRQQLVQSRDELAKRVAGLEQEVTQRWEEYEDISREIGRDGGVGSVLLQLDLKRLESVDEELMRLEGQELDVANASSGNRAPLEKRIAQLRKQQQDLERSVERRSSPSTELELRKQELGRLQRIIDELSLKLEYAELEVRARGW